MDAHDHHVNDDQHYVKYHHDIVHYDDGPAIVVHDDACTDDECPREHVYHFTSDQLAARDAANYDAGYNAADAARYAADLAAHHRTSVLRHHRASNGTAAAIGSADDA